MSTTTDAQPFVTDGGLETDLIYHHGFDLPEFAAFPLVENESGRDALKNYYAGYAATARAAAAGLLLETPTWRANPDWGALLGYDANRLDRANQASVELLRGVRARLERRPAAGAGQRAGRAARRRLQAGRPRRPRRGGRLPPPAAGLVRRGRRGPGDGADADRRGGGDRRRPRRRGRRVCRSGSGSPSRPTAGCRGARPSPRSIARVDADTPPTYFVVNCAHPTHVLQGVDEGPWRDRVHGLRVNASTMSHEELDNSEELDDGDPVQLAADTATLRAALPAVRIVGGCCGTDARHVAAMWA